MQKKNAIVVAAFGATPRWTCKAEYVGEGFRVLTSANVS
jgi:hypothetical protein